MKKLNPIILAALFMCVTQFSWAQLCTGVKGPNLLGAKGTFSAPFITPNGSAAGCLTTGDQTYNPAGNVGNALLGCTASIGDILPCSDYTYTASELGMESEFTYSLLKVMGDATGSNCIHNPIWTAKDHTGDGGYFMAVNGAPNVGFSPLFYQIKQIPVCIGTTYEFSAWVINMMPAKPGVDDAAPNVSFYVNGVEIGNSGPIPYDNQWHQVGGQFTATTPVVDLQVINATQVAGGNDLGLDDISFRVCQSQIQVSGPVTVTEGSPVTAHFVVSDPIDENTWFKMQFSSDGGVTFNNISTGEQRAFGPDHTYTVDYPIFGGGPAVSMWNGFQFRLVVSTSKEGLEDPECIYINDYRLIVSSEGTLPVQLTSFEGSYNHGKASLNWQTSQEINTDRFELSRSFDGNHFETVTTINAAGNSSQARQYKYIDQLVTRSGEYVYYKLKMVDKDEKFSFSDVVKLTLDDNKSKFTIFPNPVTNHFTASFHAAKSANATLLIRNTNGQTVYSKQVNVLKGNNSVTISDATLASGMYYITIGNSDFSYQGKLQKK